MPPRPGARKQEGDTRNEGECDLRMGKRWGHACASSPMISMELGVLHSRLRRTKTVTAEKLLLGGARRRMVLVDPGRSHVRSVEITGRHAVAVEQYACAVEQYPVIMVTRAVAEW